MAKTKAIRTAQKVENAENVSKGELTLSNLHANPELWYKVSTSSTCDFIMMLNLPFHPYLGVPNQDAN